MGHGYCAVDGSDEQGTYTLLKITSQQDAEASGEALILEGRLAGPWVEELRAYCRRTDEYQQLCRRIDLTGVSFIDAEGKVLLTQLWQQGVELRASGCLTKCLVEDITKAGCPESSGQQGGRIAS